MTNSTIRVSLFAVILLATDAAAVEFKFAPPDGLECDQYLKTSSVTELKGIGDDVPKREDVSDSVAHAKYEKAPTGYKVKTTIKSVDMTRDGKPAVDPVSKLLAGREFTMDVQSNGKASDVHGYDDFIDAVLASVPAEVRTMVSKSLNADSMANREIMEWNSRVGDFVGKQAEAGDVWEGDSEYPLPTGPVKFKSLTRISKIEDRAGHPIVTLNFTYAADGAATRKMMDDVQKGLKPLTKGIEVKIGEPSIQGTGERVIDASTMSIERESISRTITMPMDVPEKGRATMVRTETHEYKFKCNK
ncbi:MAG TPA: hypothetical protein VN634_16285 [Candidatus Limnocylindrales bacterium]|nr:hypothetical protein [Candidatus Limnocylindrales bacterium]